MKLIRLFAVFIFFFCFFSYFVFCKMDEVIVQDRSSPEPSSYGQIHFPFGETPQESKCLKLINQWSRLLSLDGAGSDLGAGIDRDTTGSSSTSSSFQSLPVEFSSGQIATNDWSASSVVDEDQQFQTFDSWINWIQFDSIKILNHLFDFQLTFKRKRSKLRRW